VLSSTLRLRLLLPLFPKLYRRLLRGLPSSEVPLPSPNRPSRSRLPVDAHHDVSGAPRRRSSCWRSSWQRWRSQRSAVRLAIPLLVLVKFLVLHRNEQLFNLHDILRARHDLLNNDNDLRLRRLYDHKRLL
jgi:hypothetical protein